MSCGCNSNPCSCQPRPSVCCAPTQESVLYTFENGNLTGVGVFDNETDFLVQFRGIVSDSSSLTVTLNAVDNTIVLDFDSAALVADIPDATTTQRGILETSTNAEAQAKAATDKILTPSNLAALGGTTTFSGLLELATDAETITGTDTVRATTPAGVAAAAALYKTMTFADAVARGAAVPGFAGQFGAQLDTEQAYVAGSAAAGDWNGLFTFGGITTMSGATTLNLNGSSLTLTGGGLVIDGTNTNSFGGNYTFNNATVTLSNVTTWDFGTDTVLKIGAATVPANSVLTTGGIGVISSTLQSDFISVQNTQTGYTTFTNPATLRTLNTATATTQQVAQCLGTLIEDLKAVLLPAT